MYKMRTLIFYVFLLSCNSNTAHQDKTIEKTDTTLSERPSFPMKPLQVLSSEKAGFGADIRLSYIDSRESDRSTIYNVSSTYNNETIGFEIEVPSPGYGNLTFKSLGIISDNFIQFLAKLYEQKVDTTLEFTQQAVGLCLDMGAYIDGLNKQGDGTYTGATGYKVIMKDEEGNSAAFYLDVNTKEHWIEMREKNSDYRPSIIALLSKK